MKKQYGVVAIVAISILVAIAALMTSRTRAQETYTGPKWEYLELSTAEPANFSTVVGTGYFMNGEFRTHTNPDLKLHALINYLGTQGWELIEDVNNQIFIFKRPLP